MNRPDMVAGRNASRSSMVIERLQPDQLQREKTPLALEYLRIVRRWKFAIGGVVFGFMVAGLLVTLLMTPKFTATTQIEIARESDKIVNLQGVQQEATDADQEFYQTQYGLLRSQSLAERVVGKLGLEDDPAFFKMLGVRPSQHGGQDAVNGRFSPADRDLRTRIAGEALLKDVAINPTRLSRLVEVSITTPDAALSARIANAWAENFIQATLQRRYDASSYARNFLEERLEQLRRRLEESERQLVTYASQQRIINLPTTGGPSDSRSERSLVADNLSTLNDELARATAERIKAQARFDELRTRGGDSSEALDNTAINTLRSRRAELAAEYEKMATQFEPAYPALRALQSQIQQIDRSIAREESRISQSLGSDYHGAVAREQVLSDRVEGLKAGLLDLRRRSIQYNIYQREVDTNRTLYDGLLQRYKEIGITAGVGVNNIAIVDPATKPDHRSSPRLVLNLLLAGVLGTIVGAGVALLLEHIDESIMDPDEVRQRLGLALLGTVPRTTGPAPADAMQDRKSVLFDAYLAVQANLRFATDHGLPSIISVTSTRPAEGKSVTSLALATTLTRSGHSVVLVDGDMRSPSIHHLLGRGHDHGLSNYLAGDDALEPMLVPAEQYGFVAMTAGPVPLNAAELLTSDRLARLLDQLIERFDHVVIDSPPVMGLADAQLIGSRAEGVIYVVESHGIRLRQVRIALDRLNQSGARVLGGVLTKFDAQRSNVAYEYGYGYGREPSNQG